MPAEPSSATEPPANALGPLRDEFLPGPAEPLSKTCAGKIPSIRLPGNGPARWGELVAGQFWCTGRFGARAVLVHGQLFIVNQMTSELPVLDVTKSLRPFSSLQHGRHQPAPVLCSRGEEKALSW